ncbi:MAG: glycosyltransferase [Candidatus Omnitrophica bacterium]|nr:glycosyltransferase [Candidatus Omnitrophota bacterium]
MSALTGENIICFSADDWWIHNPHANAHLMLAFSERNKVLYINSTGIRVPDFKTDKFFAKRFVAKLKSFLRYFRRVRANMYVLTPFALPLFPRIEQQILTVNKWLLFVQIKVIQKMINLRRPIIWVTAPVFRDIAFLLKRRAGKALIYYCVDNFWQFPGVNAPYIQQLEKDIQAQADITFFVNEQIAVERRAWGGTVSVSTHGVDFDVFAEAGASTAVPSDMASLPRPIVGYIGEIKPLDFKMIKFLASEHRDKSFVFIGDIYEALRTYQFPDNVFFLGKKPYDELPAYMRQMDCFCLYYDIDDPFNRYRNPKKLLEYFAVGKPVISVELAPLNRFRECIYIATTKEEFSGYLSKVIRNDPAEMKQQRIEIARAHTWECVAARIGKKIRAVFDPPRTSPR